MKLKLYMMRGLPGCGKTTRALKMVEESKGHLKRVNNDELRLMIDGGEWSHANEKAIKAVREGMIKGFLLSGFSVIVDNLNFGEKHENTYRQLAATFGAEFEIIDMTDVPLFTCVERDRARPNSVGEKVIWKWYRDYIAPNKRRRWMELISHDFNEDTCRRCGTLKSVAAVQCSAVPRGIIVDLDGTLAEGIGIYRGPFEWDKVYLDKPVLPVLQVIKAWNYRNFMGDVLFVSGRDEICRADTEEWLRDLGFETDENGIHKLYMRKHDDRRPDTVVKKEIFENYIEKEYHIDFVLDDRPSVVRMWRELGLFVFDCGMGVDF